MPKSLGVWTSLAEMMQPQTVDHDACGQRIGGIDDPLRQLHSPATSSGWNRLPAEKFQPTARDFFAEFLGIASHMNMSVGHGPFADGVSDLARWSMSDEFGSSSKELSLIHI